MHIEEKLSLLLLLSLPIMALSGLVALIYFIFQVVRRVWPGIRACQPQQRVPLSTTNPASIVGSRGTKALMITSYAVGSLLVVAASWVTIVLAGTLLQGHNLTGELEANYGDYVIDALVAGGFWSHAVLLLGIAHLLRTMKDKNRCRQIARLLCAFVPVGTLVGSLTLIHLREKGHPSHPA